MAEDIALPLSLRGASTHIRQANLMHLNARIIREMEDEAHAGRPGCKREYLLFFSNLRCF
jgi:hypothetical protein